MELRRPTSSCVVGRYSFSSQRCNTRVPATAAANTINATRTADSETVTSPTLKPKKAARRLPIMSLDSTPHGAKISIAPISTSTSDVAPRSRIASWRSEP